MGGQRPRNGLPVQAGCCPASPHRCRSACHASQARSIRAGVEPGICLVRQNVQKSRSGSARHRRRSARRPGKHGRDCEFPGPAGPGQFSGVAGDGVQHRGDPGQAGGNVSGAWPVVAGAQVRIEIPSAWAGASAHPFPFGLLQPPCRPRNPGQDSPLPLACPDPLVDRHPPIVPAVFRKLDAVAVLTARLLPAPLTGGPGWLCPWLSGGPGFRERQAGRRRRGRWR